MIPLQHFLLLFNDEEAQIIVSDEKVWQTNPKE
jgi:hypothetical protein